MKKKFDYILAIFGLLLLTTGLCILKFIVQPQGILLTLPYILIGLGCGTFGHGMGNIISKRLTHSNPERARKIAIEANDERNISITNMSKARAYDAMLFIFGALMICFALLNVDLAAILLLVSAYLFVVGYGIYYRMKYEKER